MPPGRHQTCPRPPRRRKVLVPEEPPGRLTWSPRAQSVGSGSGEARGRRRGDVVGADSGGLAAEHHLPQQEVRGPEPDVPPLKEDQGLVLLRKRDQPPTPERLGIDPKTSLAPDSGTGAGVGSVRGGSRAGPGRGGPTLGAGPVRLEPGRDWCADRGRGRARSWCEWAWFEVGTGVTGVWGWRCFRSGRGKVEESGVGLVRVGTGEGLVEQSRVGVRRGGLGRDGSSRGRNQVGSGTEGSRSDHRPVVAEW